MSWSSLQARMRLARQAGRTPALARALAEGRIGFEAAVLLGRVIRVATAEAWIERAEVRTFKHLREEVEAVQALARAEGLGHAGGPPTDAQMEAWHEAERRVLAGEAEQMSGGSETSDVDGADGAESSADEAFAKAASALPVKLRLRLRQDLFDFWRALCALHAVSGLPGTFLGWLCRTFFDVWRPQHDRSAAYWSRYAHDRFRCSSPTCDRRDVTPHHVTFRSRGGGDELANIRSLCVCCHLELLHQGRLKAEHGGGDVVWTFGRQPVMEVEGRCRQQLA